MSNSKVTGDPCGLSIRGRVTMGSLEVGCSSKDVIDDVCKSEVR